MEPEAGEVAVEDAAAPETGEMQEATTVETADAQIATEETPQAEGPAAESNTDELNEAAKEGGA